MSQQYNASPDNYDKTEQMAAVPKFVNNPTSAPVSDFDPNAVPPRSGRQAQESFWSKRSTHIALVVIAVVVVLVGGAFALDYATSYNKVHKGVTVADIEVGGLTKDEATDKISAELDKDLTQSITVTSGKKNWEATSEILGASYDASALATQAYNVGKSGSFLHALGRRLASWTGGVTIPVTFAYDEAAFGPFVEMVSEKTVDEPVQSKVKISDAKTTVVPGSDGTMVDVEALQKELDTAFLGTIKEIELPIVEAPMDITPEIAAAGAEIAETMMSDGATATHKDKSWEFSPEMVGEWISFETTQAADGTWSYTPYINPKKSADDMREKIGALGKEPKDATFKASGGKVEIIPSETGTGVNTKKLANDFTTALKNEDLTTHTAAVEIDTIQPSRTTEDAEKMGIKERISTYSTSYNGGQANRVNNIHKLAEYLDNSLVAPGGTWSFLQTCGPRTAERGFKEAGAIVEGELVDQLGGGICQVATTTFNAIYEAGLPVVERHPHSQYISHYPTGRDAAVSGTSPDLKFKNNTDNWILVKTSYSGSSVTISLYGTDPGYTISTSTGSWRNFTSPATKEIKDPTLAEGTKKVKQGGSQGKSITVTRTVSKDGKVIRTDTFNSTYKAVPKIVLVGTKKVEKKDAKDDKKTDTKNPKKQDAGNP